MGGEGVIQAESGEQSKEDEKSEALAMVIERN